MGFEFKHKVFDWGNEGTEPNDELKRNGFQSGYKPPAAFFNAFWNRVSKAIKELQENLNISDDNSTVGISYLDSQVYELGERVDVLDTLAKPLEAYSEDGINYTVNSEAITQLYNGMEITIIPNMKNATTAPRLKINNFTDNGIRMALSFNCAATTTVKEDFFSAGRPITLKYHSTLSLGVQGQGAWLFSDRLKTSAQDLYGTVPIEGGGTGATSIKDALKNLGLENGLVVYSGTYKGGGLDDVGKSSGNIGVSHIYANLIVVQDSTNGDIGMFMRPSTFGYNITKGKTIPINWTIGGNGVTWYRENADATTDFCVNNRTYNYTIIGTIAEYPDETQE